MSLILRNNFLPDFNDEFLGNDLFPSFFDNAPRMNMPAVNISEDNDSYKIDLAAPGLEKNDFKIEIKNNVLTISSEKQNNKEEKDEKFMRKEFNYCSFKRSFALPQTADTEKINAMHNNGILSVQIHKKEEAKEKPMRQIEIK